MKQCSGSALLIVVFMLMIGGLLMQLSYQGAAQLHKIFFFYEHVQQQEDLLNQALYSVIKIVSTQDIFFAHHNQEYAITYDITSLYTQLAQLSTAVSPKYAAPRLFLMLKSTKNRLLAPTIKLRITLYDDQVCKAALTCLLTKIKKGDEHNDTYCMVTSYHCRIAR